MVSPYDVGTSLVPAAAESGLRDSCPEQNLQTAPPIFIHSSWRASHTWFWLKFREQPSTVCFYEPFNEHLATLTRSEALSRGPNSWNSGHPAAEAYYREFLPLIRKAGGVRLFLPEISFQWFLPTGGPAGDLRPEEIKYLALLIRHAERIRRIPVFGFARSLGRLAAIKNRFPGIHIFQYRNLWAQWVSLDKYRRNGDKYFFDRIFHIMANAQDPYLSSIMNRYVVRYLPSLAVEKGKTGVENNNSIGYFTVKLLEVIPQRDLFCLFMAFHTYLYMLARQNADIVIDVTKVARDGDYQTQAYDRLILHTGLSITLDDVVETQQYYRFDPTLIDWKEIRENVNFAVLTLDHAFDRQELLRYGSELIDETLAEISLRSEKTRNVLPALRMRLRGRRANRSW